MLAGLLALPCAANDLPELPKRDGRPYLTELKPAPALPIYQAPCPQTLLRLGQQDGISQFLNQFPTIRIGVNQAPGFGHQVSSVHLIARLRQSGYRGSIELIYEQFTETQLRTLVPGFQPSGNAVQKFPNRDLTLIAEETFERYPQRFPEVGLAMVGAEDEMKSFIPLNNRPSKPARYRAKTLLRLQPASWLEGTQSVESSDGRKESLEDLKPLQYAILDNTPADSLRFLRDQGQPQSSLPRTAFLGRLLDAKAPFEVAAFYNAHPDRLPTLMRYVDGVREAVERTPALFKAGVIVPVLSELSDYNLQNLRRMVAEYPSFAQVRVFDLADTDLPTEAPPAGAIWIVRAAGLSPPLIRAILEKSEIPPAISGKYSRNQTLRMGRPFLEARFSDLSEDLPMPPKIQELLKSALFDMGEELPHDRPLTYRSPAITAFIQLARAEEGAAIRETFRQKMATDPLTDDKFWQAMLRLRTFVNASRP